MTKKLSDITRWLHIEVSSCRIISADRTRGAHQGGEVVTPHFFPKFGPKRYKIRSQKFVLLRYSSLGRDTTLPVPNLTLFCFSFFYRNEKFVIFLVIRSQANLHPLTLFFDVHPWLIIAFYHCSACV